MELSEFNYDLPQELIAQVPIKNRDESRLLILDRSTEVILEQFIGDAVKKMIH